MSDLKTRIQEDMKIALRSGDKRRLGALRLILSSIKQREIDERVTLDDSQVLGVLDKMVKQRQDSLAQYQSAGREDLAEQESFEIQIIQGYMPAPLTADELSSLIEDAIKASGAASPRDMGKVVAALRPKVQGRADMGQVSAMVKTRLTAES